MSIVNCQNSRVVTYHERLSPLNLHDTLIRWPYEITWQKNTYLYLQKTYEHHTRQGADLTVRGSNAKCLACNCLLFLLLFVRWTDKVIFIFFSNYYFKLLWLGSELLISYAARFQTMSIRDKQSRRIENESPFSTNQEH